MADQPVIAWKDDVDARDFTAAYNYLSLRLSPPDAEDLVEQLRHAKLERRRANDVLRACDRSPLPLTDPGVHRALGKVLSGKALSPVLVVSFDFGGEIADGYHRVSLAYGLDPAIDVPMRLASWPDPRRRRR